MSFSLKDDKKHNPQKEAEKIVIKAQHKSEDLLVEATKEAEIIIGQTKDFRNELQSKMRDDIAYQTQQFAQSYQQFLPEIKKYYQQGIDAQLQAVKAQLDEAVVEIKNSLKTKVEEIQTLLKNQTIQELTSVQNELQAYKKQQMSEIDAKVRNTVKAASLEVLGKSLSISDHQELIVQAIEKAKKDGIFVK